MKKALILLLCLVMVLSLAACKSEEAQRVDKLIDDIGEVTLDSNKAIYNAEKEVENLAEEDRNQLENVEKLESMHEEYNNLVHKSHAEKVEKLIADLGEITRSSATPIEKAQKAYDKLPDVEQKMVENYDVLEAAQEKLSEIKAKKVEELIDKIGKVTLKSKDKIEDAEKEYKNLSSDDKAKVSNSADLTKAKETLEKLEKQEAEKKKQEEEKRKKQEEAKKKQQKEEAKQRYQNALSSLASEYDNVTKTTWYFPTSKPQYINERCYVLPYLATSGDSCTLYLEANYYGDDWVFFKKLIINADDQVYNRSIRYFDINHDASYGTVTENYNHTAETGDITWLRAIADSNNAVVRFQGDADIFDLTISAADKTGIANVLNAYEAYLDTK